MWFRRPAKPQISLRRSAVWSEPLLVAWIIYDCSATDWTPYGVSKLKRRLHRPVWVYTCQNATLLEITCHGSNYYDNDELNVKNDCMKICLFPYKASETSAAGSILSTTVFYGHYSLFAKVLGMKLVVTCDYQQCGILTCVDSELPVQPHFKLRNSK